MRITKTVDGIEIRADEDSDKDHIETIFSLMSESIERSSSKSEYVQIGVDSLAAVERRVVLDTLRFFGGHKGRAADVLGISLKTLYNKLNSYGIWRGS